MTILSQGLLGKVHEGYLPMPKSFAEFLSFLREKSGWSGERLAEEAEISQSLISKYETGERTNPRRSTVRKLSDALSRKVAFDKAAFYKAAGFVATEEEIGEGAKDLERMPEDVEYIVTRYSNLSDSNKRFAQKMIEELEKSERGEESEEQPNPYANRKK